MTNDEKIAQMEADGNLDPHCPTCQAIFYPHYREKWLPGDLGPFAPPHKPSERCRSGKHPHCTCDTCF